MSTISEGSPEIASALQAFATATQALLSLQRKQAAALGRIADALEQANAITQHDPDVAVVRVSDIRDARRETLLGYARGFGVDKWAEQQGIDYTTRSNKLLREWCIALQAGDEPEL